MVGLFGGRNGAPRKYINIVGGGGGLKTKFPNIPGGPKTGPGKRACVGPARNGNFQKRPPSRGTPPPQKKIGGGKIFGGERNMFLAPRAKTLFRGEFFLGPQSGLLDKGRPSPLFQRGRECFLPRRGGGFFYFFAAQENKPRCLFFVFYEKKRGSFFPRLYKKKGLSVAFFSGRTTNVVLSNRGIFYRERLCITQNECCGLPLIFPCI